MTRIAGQGTRAVSCGGGAGWREGVGSNYSTTYKACDLALELSCLGRGGSYVPPVGCATPAPERDAGVRSLGVLLQKGERVGSNSKEKKFEILCFRRKQGNFKNFMVL